MLIRVYHDESGRITGHTRDPLATGGIAANVDTDNLHLYRVVDGHVTATRLPRLVVTGITADPQWGISVSDDFADVTVPAGAVLTITAELRAPDAETVLPVDATFRMPVRARDGREMVVLAGIQAGVATVDIPLRQSGSWSSTEALINSGLPHEQQMQFAGVTAFVLEH